MRSIGHSSWRLSQDYPARQAAIINTIRAIDDVIEAIESSEDGRFKEVNWVINVELLDKEFVYRVNDAIVPLGEMPKWDLLTGLKTYREKLAAEKEGKE